MPDKVEIHRNTVITSLNGNEQLTSLNLRNIQNGAEEELPVDGLFVNIGVVPNTAMFAPDIDLSPDGRIIAGEDCQTNVPGVFAAGDVRVKPIRQLTTAAADGTVAALLAEKYIEKLKEEK